MSHLLRIFSQRLALGLPHLTSFQSLSEAIYLYNNKENATKCNKMQHFSENFSDRLPLAVPI